MKSQLHHFAVRLSALATSVILVLVCILSTGVTVEAAVTDPYIDVDFETYLTQQSFPESYKIKLRELHQKYPNWIFEAQHTNMDWSTVIAAESKVGVNLTENSNPTSWKSTAEGAYDWETGTWVELDSGNWVAASEAIISYYMDPRNTLDATYIFQFLKQSYDAEKQTKEGLASVVSGTYLAGTYAENGAAVSYLDTIMQAAGSSGVSPYTLASMMIIEQGTRGDGKCISGTVSGYEGYYNYFNVGAYKTSTMTAVQRGLWYAKGSGTDSATYDRPWNTRTKSILGGATYYGSNYIAKGQDTLYLKKYNVQGTNPFTHQYMTNVRGATLEAAKMAKAYSEEARNANLIFKIPVYLNMPETACVKPTDNSTPVKDVVPETPIVPEVPEAPVVPDTPAAPETPTTPETPTPETPNEGDNKEIEQVPTEEKKPDGDIVLGDVTGNVGDQIIVDATINAPNNNVTSEKVVISYDDSKLQLLPTENVSGGAGTAIIDKTKDKGSSSSTTKLTFQILQSGSHSLGVTSYEVKNADEEILTLDTTDAVVTGAEPVAEAKEETQPTGQTVPAKKATQKKAVSSQTAEPVQSENTVGGGDTTVAEEIAENEETSVTPEFTPINENDVKKNEKKTRDVDADKYNDKQVASATAIGADFQKQIVIIVSCALVIGVGTAAAYFFKGFRKR